MNLARAGMRVDGETTLFGVFGHPIAHTFSPALHEMFIRAHGGNMAYIAYHVLPEDLGAAVRGAWAMGIRGLNLTIPHKEAVLPLLCGIDGDAAKVGAVNTLKWTPDGYYGYNTDVYGMRQQLRNGGMYLAGRKVLLLGAGGAARGALTVCHLEGASEVMIYNRHPERAEALISRFMKATEGEKRPAMRVITHEELVEGDHPYVIQTTPAGMLHIPDTLPVTEEAFYRGIEYAADAVYHPLRTPFLQKVRAQGGVGLEGQSMLFYQGARSFEIWNEFAFEDTVREALRAEFLDWAARYFV